MSTPSVAPAPVIKGRALLFGLNSEGTANELQGCVQDVVNIGAYLSRTLQLPAKVCTDAKSTSAMAIVQGMYELALQSYSESLDYVWIHYSGHGSYVVDRNGDERDGPAAAFLTAQQPPPPGRGRAAGASLPGRPPHPACPGGGRG